MELTRDTFIEEYPEFSDIPVAIIDRNIRDSSLMLSGSVWGKWYTLAQKLWIAHYVSLEYNISDKCAMLGVRSPYDIGTVTSQSASTGSLSITTSQSALLTSDNPYEADFARTTYGMKYLTLLRSVVAPCSVVFSMSSNVYPQR